MKQYAMMALLLMLSLGGGAAERTLKVRSRYLNIPVSQKVDRHTLLFQVPGKPTQKVVVRLAEGQPDYWVFRDLKEYKGKKLTLSYEGNQEALDRVYQSDTIMGQSSFYQEEMRPQFHFSPLRGWNNDPNGLIYYKGKYHLYFQHNPMEREWENMTWGHATSPDLLHWTEQGDVLFPDSLGTMFSGSAVLDTENTSGLGSKRNPPIVYAYTADRPGHEVQCIAWSLDGGKSLKKYKGNPVVDSFERWQTGQTRDPRLLWYNPGKHWVMVLYEKDGHSFYTSDNLLDWTYRSHVSGFYECPEFFELPVDGNENNTRWVLMDASNGYMIGKFDGQTFTPETEKLFSTSGNIYAAQTYSNVPNGRRIQIGWGRVNHGNMPFNGMMLLPTELSLKSTPQGIRLVSRPVKEMESLLHPVVDKKATLSVDEASSVLNGLECKELHLRFCLCVKKGKSGGLSLNGQKLLEYNSHSQKVGDFPYKTQNESGLELNADVYIDRTNVEVFVDEGLYSYSLQRELEKDSFVLRFEGEGVQVRNLHIDTIDSVWKKK